MGQEVTQLPQSVEGCVEPVVSAKDIKKLAKVSNRPRIFWEGRAVDRIESRSERIGLSLTLKSFAYQRRERSTTSLCPTDGTVIRFQVKAAV